MTLPQDIAKLQSEMNATVREHWKAFLFEGILLAVLGLAAIILPPLASLAVTIFLGWMFLISGVAGLALTFWARQMPGFWWSLISAALAVLAGLVLLAQPVQGAFTLTIVVGVYFLAEGVATIMYALEHRRELSDRWSWMLFSGVLDILIAAMIITGWPGSAERPGRPERTRVTRTQTRTRRDAGAGRISRMDRPPAAILRGGRVAARGGRAR